MKTNHDLCINSSFARGGLIKKQTVIQITVSEKAARL
jgi:ribosomal protein S8E